MSNRLINKIKTTCRTALREVGYDIVPANSAKETHEFPPDFDAGMIDICRAVQPYTMTSPERIFALCRSVEYVLQHNVPGDIVECGVWKGGSMMAVARTLLKHGAERKLYLFDTFEGMSQPTDTDKDFQGQLAVDRLGREDRDTSMVWAYCPLDHVRHNMERTGYDKSKVAFVQGKVEATIPQHAPECISILRLDTDWYESTYHELKHLYPRLSVGGVLIIDDYGHWEGARKAVDRYIEENGLKILLNRIDYTGRVGVKP